MFLTWLNKSIIVAIMLHLWALALLVYVSCHVHRQPFWMEEIQATGHLFPSRCKISCAYMPSYLRQLSLGGSMKNSPVRVSWSTSLSQGSAWKRPFSLWCWNSKVIVHTSQLFVCYEPICSGWANVRCLLNLVANTIINGPLSHSLVVGHIPNMPRELPLISTIDWSCLSGHIDFNQSFWYFTRLIGEKEDMANLRRLSFKSYLSKSTQKRVGR